MADISIRLIDLPHFKDGALSSALSVSYVSPKLNDKGYVDSAAFFVTIRKPDGNATTLLSEMEAALLVARLQEALGIAASGYMKLVRDNPRPQKDEPRKTTGFVTETDEF